MKITFNRVAPLLGLAWLILSAVFAPVAVAFIQKLHSEEIQEAFSVGQSTDPEAVTQFFQKYSRQFDCQGSDPCIDSIELRTPFEEVAVQSRKHNSNYTEQDAERSYAAHFARLSVRIFVLRRFDSLMDADPSNEEGLSGGDNGFSFYGYLIRVSQAHTLKPETVRSKSLYFGGSQCEYCGGEEIILDFDPTQFDSAVTRIDVLTPSGQEVKASFDLRDLK